MSEPPTMSKKRGFVQWFVHLLVIFLCVGNAVPGINESHYIPKAKHLWDSSFAAGDLFLESHNAHLLASLLAGALAEVFSLAVVAWAGRLLSWAVLAWVWIAFCRALDIPRLLSPLALASWYFAVAHGHWAGEWAIGGFEAKTIAYPCVLLGIVGAIEDRWRSVWLWMGLAVAWHPVAGGWAGLSVGLIWLWLPDLRTRLGQQLPWLGLGALIGLVGVVPALLGIGGEDRSGNVVASQIHVYYRLPHHMLPRTFANERHVAAGLSLLALVGATIFWKRTAFLKQKPFLKRKPFANDAQPASASLFIRLGRLVAVAWIAVGFSLVGLLIDVILCDDRLPTFQPEVASKLLRFYWFRWSDVAVPLAWTAVFWSFAGKYVNGRRDNTANNGQTNSISDMAGRVVVIVGVAITLLCAANAVTNNWRTTVPAADRLLVDSVGRRAIQTDRYVDWLAVCEWIRSHTPADSLWLTPRDQQTFKWYAQRAEVVCWKDVPQDNRSVLEWYARVERCQPPRDRFGKVRPWTTKELVDLCKEYGCQWILLDRTTQLNPPLLEIAYPINVLNRSFVVFRFRE